MGYPLSASLFVGPKLKKNLNMCQWMFILNILTKEQIIEKIKNSDGYEEDIDDDDEENLMLSWGDESYVDKFVDKFFDFIKKHDFEMVIEYNYQADSFLLGRRIENVHEDISKDIEFWKQYKHSNLLDVHIFAGMHGRIEYSLDFNLP